MKVLVERHELGAVVDEGRESGESATQTHCEHCPCLSTQAAATIGKDAIEKTNQETSYYIYHQCPERETGGKDFGNKISHDAAESTPGSNKENCFHLLVDFSNCFLDELVECLLV